MAKRYLTGLTIEPSRFFSIEGRIGAVRFATVFATIMTISCMIAWGFATFDAATFSLLGAVGGAAVAKLFAEAGRRCHDRDRSATVGVLVLIGTFLALFFILSLLIAGLVAVAVGAVATLAFATTFLRPGQTTANSYGEPPSGVLRSGTPNDVRTSNRSLAWAAVSILGCAAIGLAIQTITNQIRSDRESRKVASTLHSPPMSLSGGIEE